MIDMAIGNLRATWARWRRPGSGPSLLPHPLSVIMLLFSLASGLSILLGGPTTASIDRQLSPVVISAWGILLAVGSAISLAGVVWRPPLVGLLLERVGAVALVPAVLLYVGAAFATLGLDALTYPVMLVCAFGIGVALRFAQIQRYIWHVSHLAKGL